VKVFQEGFCPDFYTIDLKLNEVPIVKIEDQYYCKNDIVGIDIVPDVSGLNVVYYSWKLPDGTMIEGADKKDLTNIKTLGTYVLTLTNSSNFTYTTSL